jgi:hypothetical protein
MISRAVDTMGLRALAVHGQHGLYVEDSNTGSLREITNRHWLHDLGRTFKHQGSQIG